ncbi:hypothetical protein NQ317_018698 [Molorchus minor]|uniref:Uncharacterized protein n=1 Tax=Molorchus minor TaxID=1323400 RepID=A0ABQ9JQL7_9CUCU|nr:hypothetical protein NQ317_018698 [Molorchus minor]
MDRSRDYSPRGKSMSISPEIIGTEVVQVQDRRILEDITDIDLRRTTKSHIIMITLTTGVWRWNTSENTTVTGEYRRDREHSWEVERKKEPIAKSRLPGEGSGPSVPQRRDRERDHHRPRRRSKKWVRWERKSEDRKLLERQISRR